MPRATLEVVDGARHALPVERPAVFNAVVGRFFQEVEEDDTGRQLSVEAAEGSH
jgi:hypothetical protein